MSAHLMLRAAGMSLASITLASLAVAGPADGIDAAGAASPIAELTVGPPADYPDVRLFNGYGFSGQAAFNPRDPKRLAVGIVVVGNPSQCSVRTSADGGKTWAPPVPLRPLPGAIGTCYYQFVPAITYGADGRLYAAYVYHRSSAYGGVAVSSSADQGQTWTVPKSAFGDVWLEDSLDNLRLAPSADGHLYAGAILSNYAGGGYQDSILFSSSADQGSSWSPVKSVITTYPDTGRTIYGFSLAAGRKGDVLVAYGWEEYRSDYYSILKVARSTNHGGSFTYGAADEQPGSRQLSVPDIKIGPLGTAHLVYLRDVNTGAEVDYKFSSPPYQNWSATPVRLGAGATVRQPLLALGGCGAATVLHATWREYVTNSTRIRYVRRLARAGSAWSAPLKVGQINSVFEQGLAAAGPNAFAVFSGRTSTGPDKWGILGSRISSGITCP